MWLKAVTSLHKHRVIERITNNLKHTIMTTLAIYENKSSERVVKFVTIEQLQELTSKQYLKRIIDALENGSLWGVYFTKNGNIRATFI